MEPEEQLDRGVVGALPDVLAIIESAKARGGLSGLERHIARALPEATPAEAAEAAEVALEIIETIPVFLARARQEADDRQLSTVVYPLLDRAEQYFLQPVDLIPEMTQGLPGLLDDAYLVIRVLQNLDRGPNAFLDWDLDYPAHFLQRVIGPEISQRLEKIAAQAMLDVSANLAELFDKLAHPA